MSLHIFPHETVTTAEIEARMRLSDTRGKLTRSTVLRRIAAAGIEPIAAIRSGQGARFDRQQVEDRLFGRKQGGIRVDGGAGKVIHDKPTPGFDPVKHHSDMEVFEWEQANDKQTKRMAEFEAWQKARDRDA